MSIVYIKIDFRYRNAVNQYAQLIRQRYAENEIKVEVMNHPVPQWKQVKIDFKSVRST